MKPKGRNVTRIPQHLLNAGASRKFDRNGLPAEDCFRRPNLNSGRRRGWVEVNARDQLLGGLRWRHEHSRLSGCLRASTAGENAFVDAACLPSVGHVADFLHAPSRRPSLTRAPASQRRDQVPDLRSAGRAVSWPSYRTTGTWDINRPPLDHNQQPVRSIRDGTREHELANFGIVPCFES